MRREDQEEVYAIAHQVFREEIKAAVQALKDELPKIKPAPEPETVKAEVKKGGK